ncbi:MAG: sodium:solute symporter, partial [Opitutaceae bacterium]|nr:sodium:solute symporter [Opitutaceae bacterium]
FTVAAEHGKFGLGAMSGDLGHSTFWVVLVYGVVINLTNFGIDQSYVQRYVTARSDAAARRSVWLGAMLYLPIGAAFFFIGTALFAFYQSGAATLPATVDAVAKPDSVLPHFIATQLAPGLAGLVVAALCAAAMDSNLNCMATLFLGDVYRRYLRPMAGEREAMAVLHVSTLAFGLISIGAALAMIRIKQALDVWWELAGICGGGMLGLFLLGRLVPRARSRAGIIGVAAGVVVILWMTLPKLTTVPESWRSPFHGLLTTVFGTLAILGVGALAARLLERPTSNVEHPTSN